MGKCEICGRPKGDPHRYPVAGECTAPDSTDYTVSLQCLSIALRKAQEALAAARRECEGLRAALENMLRRYNEMPPVDHDCHCWTWFFPEFVSEARTVLAAGEKTT